MAVLGKSRPNEQYQKLFEAAKRARIPFDREHFQNVMFWMGEQYIEWSDEINGLRKLQKPERAPNIPRPVANKIKHFVLQEHAMTLQTRPTADVLPANDDPVKISNAAVANAYLTELADPTVANWDGELAIAALWALAGTEGYIKAVWNPRLEGGKGRGDYLACSPTDVYQDPYARDFYKARWVIHTQFMDPEAVYDAWNKDIRPSDVDQADPMRVALLREVGMAPVLHGCMVNELWMKPNRRHPKGIYVVWCGDDQLVPPSPFPYDHGQLPFAQIGSVIWPGTGHYTSIVTDMRSPQMELNKAHAQGIQIRDAFSNPKWGLPNELDMDSDPDDSPNQILRYNSGGGLVHPQIIQPTTMPNNDEGAWIAKEMMDIVGLHEVSQAQVPGRVEAAKAIELLKESDDSRLAELLRTISTAISVLSYQQLRLAKQFMTAPRMVTTYSSEGMPEVRRFLAEQIDPGMKLRVTMGTGLARSRAARVDQIMMMWQNQILTDKEQVAELLDMPISSVGPTNAFDIRLARNENFTLAEGTAIVPNSWDNHPIHTREHNNYRKTGEYAMLSDNAKSVFEHHCQTHDELYAQQLGKQLQMNQLAMQVAQSQAQIEQGVTPPPQGATPGQPQDQAGGGGESSDISPQQQAAWQDRAEFNLSHPRV